MHSLALIASSVLLASASAEQFAIPQVQSAVNAALNKYSEYVNYDGPTGTATAALASATAESHGLEAAAVTDPSYWLADITHQGNAPYADSGYVVFRNVKDYGAAGDGVTDDTAAINSAISDGGRYSPGSGETSSTTPAIVYFPAGTYLVSTSIIDYYFTQLIGNPNSPAVLKASADFTGLGVIDGDQYQSTGEQGWTSTNVFYRQIRNLVLDLTDVPASSATTGIHWPTAQATSLQNVEIRLNSDSGTQAQGIFIENGSAGFLTDVTVTGGLYGLNVGNQQYTMRNVTISNAVTAISQIWDWGWTWSGLNINNCTTAIDISLLATDGSLEDGSTVIIDSTITDCDTFVKTARSTSSTPASAGNLIIENVALNNVPTAIQGPSSVYLTGGTTTISTFGQGHEYTPTGPNTLDGTFTAPSRPSGLLASGSSDYFTKSKPQYQSYATSSVVSMRSSGATGDGTTDDTAAIQAALTSAAASGSIAFFDYGIYLVTDTIYIPPGSIVVGESYPSIMGSGSKFSNKEAPYPVVQVGKSGDTGTIEVSDIIVSTQGGAAGAILIEYNLDGDQGSGLWDVHTRIGGFDGSDLQVANCPTTAAVSADCEAAFMSLHITSSANNVYLENNWFWTADHDIDSADNTQISIYTGRGALIEGSNIIMYGTSVEHHSLYQYEFSGATNVLAGYIQTETPYYQPSPDATSGPYAYNATWNDPDYSTCLSGNCDALGLYVTGGDSIYIYGAGLYSFFNDYSTSCSDYGNSENCQSEIFRVDGTVSALRVYGLNTVGTTNLIEVDGTSEADYSDNISTYADSIALFSYN
ncbi:Glucan 1,3-beta-glucosidase [Talaromyces atroroseus]|uniref:Glucan 1,3-beta-glucosidase n=1 Tax=Talaromyces atroroseus TaxID=1441469 RepID=A0A225AUY1_TALAT|nr:Glucan 1,3-beta-glucosidase [Talaromyces atroroseus]OKL58255.1 Glucan 1,3-beta-glucosidase [Talaromyces atroroseus]